MASNNANVHDVAGNVSVPIADQERFDTAKLLDANGRGVVNGRPYGEQLLTERREMATQYLFRPKAMRALRAATRRALGR